MVDLIRKYKDNNEYYEINEYNQIVAIFGTVNDPFGHLKDAVGNLYDKYKLIKRNK